MSVSVSAVFVTVEQLRKDVEMYYELLEEAKANRDIVSIRNIIKELDEMKDIIESHNGGRN